MTSLKMKYDVFFISWGIIKAFRVGVWISWVGVWLDVGGDWGNGMGMIQR